MAAPLPDIRPDSLLLTRRSRITLFCCTAVLGYLLTGLLTTLLIYKFGTANARVLRIAAIAQDILALIAPALVTAMMVTRLPAQLLELRGGVPGRLWMAALPVMIIAAPAMNCVIEFNQNIEATGALSAIVEKMRAMEENASAMIECMQGNGTWPDLLMNILIIGIAAGVSEELFPRSAATPALHRRRKRPCRHMDKRHCIQCCAHAVLRVHTPHATRRIFRVFIGMGALDMASGSRTRTEQHHLRHRPMVLYPHRNTGCDGRQRRPRRHMARGNSQCDCHSLVHCHGIPYASPLGHCLNRVSCGGK